jgi:23S rRNA U2552 (ribose-2'-O)-methylase RlmE/FtsJ
MRRKTISSRLELFQISTSTSQLLDSANNIMQQLNVFLVEHLRGVSEETFAKKIEETFKSFDIDGTA